MDGKRRLTEVALGHLEGWRGSRPVRIGNAADKQFQSDMYGLLLELAWHWSERGNVPDAPYWDFLCEIVEASAAKWQLPDHGIWEVRCERGNFVAAFDSNELDAALLMLREVGFVAYEDARMRGAPPKRSASSSTKAGWCCATAAATACVAARAYSLHARSGSPNGLARRELFERACACANDLGLFAEEYAPRTRELLGNFPQGLTHLVHIAAALALAQG
jgi:GH15 family glucan-1,4-alpha-glucosidase